MLPALLLLADLASAKPAPRERYTKRQTIADGRVRGGQPSHTVADSFIGGFQHVGETGVAAQMMFLGTDDLVYILDKVENNPLQVEGHAAWASEYNLNTNEIRAMPILTNSFCAGGGQLADGRWINVGGNRAEIPLPDSGGNVQDAPDGEGQQGVNVYGAWDGRNTVRTIVPGTGVEWEALEANALTSFRWYPAVETLQDGRAIIIGGVTTGGFVNNNPGTNNPTYEFFPRRTAGEGNIPLPFLEDTMPANLFAITSLLPSGRLQIVANRGAIILDPASGDVTPLPEVPIAARTYPASAATVLLPLKATEDFKATSLYCGGTDLTPDQWTDPGTDLLRAPATTSCVTLTGDDTNPTWETEEDLPEGRVMGSGILLPDGKVLVVNGANAGVSGYEFSPRAYQTSLSNTPILQPLIFDPSKPNGQRWSREGLQDSDIARMYHSSATLLPDGSVFIAGSNPHADVTLDSDFPTEYRAERFYPPYYNHVRPSPELPTRIPYGGDYIDVELSIADDLFGNIGNIRNTKAVLMKTGFSTHAVNFGQRMVELEVSYTRDGEENVILHVSPPPGPTIIQPGTAWFFIVVDGIPSVGVQVLIGSGAVEEQTVAEHVTLPTPDDITETPGETGTGGEEGGSASRSTSSIPSVILTSLLFLSALLV